MEILCEPLVALHCVRLLMYIYRFVYVGNYVYLNSNLCFNIDQDAVQFVHTFCRLLF